MKHRWMLGVGVLAAGVLLGLLGGGMLTAQEEPSLSGEVLGRTVLAAADELEAILVLREVPAGAESGRHTQSGNEIVYILEGAVSVEVEGREAMAVSAGETFQTGAGDVHNVKNASADEPVRALVFYVASRGATLEDLAVPAE